MAQIAGGLIALVGLVLACVPTLVSDPGATADVFAMVERRIPYGALLGVGLLIGAMPRLKPWPVGLASVAIGMTLGVLIARVIGVFLDGFHPRQILWIVVEVIVVALAAAYLRRQQPAG
ncbi:MAG: hypothetical protein ACI9WU_001958 [Myxococcota bacterium]|jgi:hypothetical protein